MNLVWKLLRQHISIPQLAGFFLANLVGMFIVMLGVQFYRDILPVFTSEDSFMKSDFLIINKKVGMGNSLSGHSHVFSGAEMGELENQLFVEKTGKFTRAQYQIQASLGINGQSMMSTELFFESVPDEFVDVSTNDWQYVPGESKTVPIILPRSYVNMYNFGFARSHHLPAINEGVLNMVDVVIRIRGNGKDADMKGRVIGFSNRLNTILVPESFIEWSNGEYAPTEEPETTRLIVQVSNPTDPAVAQYLDDHGYELEEDRSQTEKMVYFLKMIVAIVLIIGLVISILSFYILMLSIYLLLQKNAEKLENLLLVGYSPSRTARPYQLLTLGLNILVFILALGVLWLVRCYYMEIVETVYPEVDGGTMLPAVLVGLLLLLLVSIFNLFAIRRKVMRIWKREE
jgi:hypothetical protein